MEGHPRDCCQACGGKRGGGGEDVVLYLKAQINSYHHWKHMACFEREMRTDERERCATIADAWITVSEGGRVVAMGIAEEIRARTKAPD